MTGKYCNFFFFFCTAFSDNFLSDKCSANGAQDAGTNTRASSCKKTVIFFILTTIRICQHILVTVSNITLTETPIKVSRATASE
jgi:hypothetical protein